MIDYQGMVSQLLGDRAINDFVRLDGDGSPRRFFRMQADKHSLVAVFPDTTSERELAESCASYFIGKHLSNFGVPQVFGDYEAQSGCVIFEDLGDTRLQDLAGTEAGDVLYRKTVDVLARLNLFGAQDFNTDWCWDSTAYDKRLMLERESGYFLRAFWQDLLGQTEPIGFREETTRIADKVSDYACNYFLHRDFQSRNVMIKEDSPRIIDFQGGRLGPLGYDLASLLIDPYVSLEEDFKAELLAQYYEKIEGASGLSREQFYDQYYFLLLQRNLQIIGAFSFLWVKRGKLYFQSFIEPSLGHLAGLLSQARFDAYPVLRATAQQACLLYRDRRR